MTSESPADLRARLAPLAAAATQGTWTFDWEDDCQVVYVNGESLAYLDERKDADAAFIVAVVNSWPAIDTMLARLETAEADADRMFAWGRCTDRCGGLGRDVDTRCHCGWERARSLHAEAVALRDHP